MTFEQVKSQDQAYILPTYGRVDAAPVSYTHLTLPTKRIV